MIDTKAVSAFFDRLAPDWDANTVRDDRVIETILNHAGVSAGMDVLDVACGTGVLFPDYLARNVASLCGIDLSEKMAALAKQKWADSPMITVLCGDVTETVFDRQFDCIVVYNAFPHFADPDRLIAVLSRLLKPNGRLSVAHGASREQINRHHANVTASVCCDLMPADALAAIFKKHLNVTFVRSDDTMYQVVGQAR